MKFIITALMFVSFQASSFGQSEMESKCLESIRNSCKNIQFPKIKGEFKIKGDTIEYDSFLILLDRSGPEAVAIFQRGLLPPSLILRANKDGSGTFRPLNTLLALGRLSISSFHEIVIPGQSPTIKTFSFLKWEEHQANPSLYILQLTNENANQKTNKITFIEESTLTSFGFCSILI